MLAKTATPVLPKTDLNTSSETGDHSVAGTLAAM